MSQLGYTDTPFINGMPYRVHDSERPQPAIVTPGTPASSPPSDAVVLFGGNDLSGWEKASGNGDAAWLLEADYMEVMPGTGNIKTKEHFGDCQLHVEFMSPIVKVGDGQGRGNSGVFLMGIYEIQVLDCFENPTYPDGTTGGIYGQYPPLVNSCRPPGEWQSYDIIWQAPRFDGDALISPARVTVILNGVLLHHATELKGPTTHRDIADYTAHPETGPLELQDHGDLVRFRNIWYRPVKAYDQA